MPMKIEIKGTEFFSTALKDSQKKIDRATENAVIKYLRVSAQCDRICKKISRVTPYSCKELYSLVYNVLEIYNNDEGKTTKTVKAVCNYAMQYNVDLATAFSKITEPSKE